VGTARMGRQKKRRSVVRCLKHDMNQGIWMPDTEIFRCILHDTLAVSSSIIPRSILDWFDVNPW
jgi:hypothetical protein